MNFPDSLPEGNWRWVVGYEGNYLVSDDGRVYSVPRIANRARFPQTVHGRMLKQGCGKGRDIYPAVYLQVAGEKKRRVLVHRLVAMAFLPLIDGKDCINHKNCDKRDNRVENLEWCTIAENAAHAAINGRVGGRRLTPGQVRIIKARLASPYHGILRRLGEEFGVTPEAISAIRDGKQWTHI